MVGELREEGVPIHRIGMQGHHNQGTNMLSVENSINLFRQINNPDLSPNPYNLAPLKLSVTELDITVTGAEDQLVMPRENEIRQAQLYAQLFQILRENSDIIERVTFWGMDDPRSWRADRHPNLFNADLSPKLAFDAVLDPDQFLLDFPVAEGPETPMTFGAYGTTTIGDFDMDAWNTTPSVNVNNNLQAWNFPGGTARVMWSTEAIYVFMNVVDTFLDANHEDNHQQSSVEVFLSQNNTRSPFYDIGDAQIRVNYQGRVTFGSQGPIEGLETATEETNNGYRVEMRIPLAEAAYAGRILGIEFQINYMNPATGTRGGMTTWSPSMEDTRWQSTLNWGEITLLGTDEKAPETDEPTQETPKLDIELGFPLPELEIPTLEVALNELQGAIEAKFELIESGELISANFTEESWNAFIEAKNHAIYVLERHGLSINLFNLNEAALEEIETALKALQAAFDALTLIVEDETSAVDNDDDNDTANNDGSDDAVNNDDSDDAVDNDGSDDAVDNDGSDDAVNNDDSDDAVNNDDSDDAVNNDDSDDAVDNDSSDDAVDNDSSDDAVNNDDSDDAVNNDDSDDAVNNDDSDDAVNNDGNNDTANNDGNNNATTNNNRPSNNQNQLPQAGQAASLQIFGIGILIVAKLVSKFKRK